MDKDKKEVVERRYVAVATSGLETRSDQEKNILRGYAAVVNKLSVNLGGFFEKNAPGFTRLALVDEYLKGEDDPKELFNHDDNLILARTQNDTLILSEDENGLFHEGRLIDTNIGIDTMKNVKARLITAMSYAFTVLEESWELIGGQNIRTILLAKRIYDVSPVTYPAFHQTAGISARSLTSQSDLNMESILSAVVRCERGLPATKDDVALIKEFRSDLDKIIQRVEEKESPVTLMSLDDLSKRIADLKNC